ncbi:MAG: hypothetical protein H6Q94_1077 [Nitrospirae bacterium]|nr:hypothetical protein [Nitrospirota bacterium]
MNTEITKDIPKEQWKIETNNTYQKVVGTIMGLATASLVLPVLFLRNFLSVPQEKPLVNYLCGSIYWSWALLALSIFFGTIFYYVSTKWIKQAWGQRTYLSANTIENILDLTFWLEIIFFIMGICLFVFFAVTYKVTS